MPSKAAERVDNMSQLKWFTAIAKKLALGHVETNLTIKSCGYFLHP